MYQEFSRTGSRILGALSQLHNFFVNSPVWVQPGTVPETSRDYESENQEYNEDHSHNDPHPRVGISANSYPHSVKLDPHQVHHMSWLKDWLDIFSFGESNMSFGLLYFQ